MHELDVLRIAMGRWRNEPREQCICRHCDREEVEDVVDSLAVFLYCTETSWWREGLMPRWCGSVGWDRGNV